MAINPKALPWWGQHVHFVADTGDFKPVVNVTPPGKQLRVKGINKYYSHEKDAYTFDIYWAVTDYSGIVATHKTTICAPAQLVGSGKFLETLAEHFVADASDKFPEVAMSPMVVAARLHNLLKEPNHTPFLYSGPIKKLDQNSVPAAAEKLPGVNAYTKCPCCSREDTVFELIMHLNDSTGWSREKIADWIDELHDRGIINAEFKPWEEPSDNQD